MIWMCMSDITKYNCVNLREPTSCLMFHVVRCVLFLFSERSEKCVNKNAKENKKNKSVFHSENCIYLQSRGKETNINKKMRKKVGGGGRLGDIICRMF